MINVLFVCLGNICRSPMAEGMLLHKAAQLGVSDHLKVDSAGLGNWHMGELPDPRARAECQKHGVELTHNSRMIKKSDFRNFEYILCMDGSVLREVERQHHSHGSQAKLQLMREYDPVYEGHPLDVPDPYNGDEQDFHNVYAMLDRCLDQLLEHLRQDPRW